MSFNGATPDNLYPTDIYTNEYDGFADFPRYPINFLSDLNAYIGIIFDHASYLNPLTPDQISDAVDLGTYGDTTYHMIQESLPLLDPVRWLSNPLADFLQPDLTVLVNLGYGSITQGWDPGDPSVPTPFGFLPTDINLNDVFTALVNGLTQGYDKAVEDIQTGQFTDLSTLYQLLDVTHTFGLTPSDTPTLLQLIDALSTFGHGDVPIEASNIIDAFSGSLSTALASQLPVADAGIALTTSLPAYDLTLFLDGLQDGNLLDAVGNPIAADLAIAPFALAIGLVPTLEAAAITVSEFGSLIP